jgi:hypothetical protein
MHRRILIAIFGVALWALSGSPAVAGPIGSVEWNNATFSVELLGSAGDLYTFELTADFTGFVDGQAGDPGVDQEGHFAYLVGINFKPSNGNLIGISGTPTTDATGTFTYGIDSNLSSSSTDCSAAGAGNDFFCGLLISTNDWENNSTSGDPIYTWTFTLQIANVTDADALVSDTGLRALFTDGSDDFKTSLASLTTGTGTSSVPEPSSFSLLGLGLASLASCVTRRHRSSRES